MTLPSLDLSFPPDAAGDAWHRREWLASNGRSAYASSTVGMVSSRRYHGMFVPSLPNPWGRVVMVPLLRDDIRLNDGSRGALQARALQRFRLNGLLPEWTYRVGDVVLRKRLVFVYGLNTLYVVWDHLEGPSTELHVRPFTTFRPLDNPVLQPVSPARAVAEGARVELALSGGAPPVRLRMYTPTRARFVVQPQASEQLKYSLERERGLDCEETLNSPGEITAAFEPGTSFGLALSVEAWDKLVDDPNIAFQHEAEREEALLQLVPPRAREGTAARLTLAADQFIIEPAARQQDQQWAAATGRVARSVVAGYPWFLDWGRDTMISLEGLTLSTGRYREAAAILRTFVHYVRDGLLPNLFPEGGRDGLYHTADASLWLFHAIDRYLVATEDFALLNDVFPTLREIIGKHQIGTRFGIGVDASDGLLQQGADGYQLTWMDAKVGDWVVTPRRGKAVEINALWFNALKLMDAWAKHLGMPHPAYEQDAAQAQASFNSKFWNETEQCLFDVVDPLDPAVRPNQVFAISLRYPVLARERWAQVMQRVERDLLTPVGLRSLSPQHPDYKATYDGDLRARDAAYHQGTVWAWLIGHFVDAWLRTFDAPPEAARQWLVGLEQHVTDAGVGQVSEIFDATAPFTPRGCFAQAWSVAELLRSWLATTR